MVYYIYMSMNRRDGSVCRRKGFTLIELLIVVSIIGLLASAVLVGLKGFRSAGRDARRIADVRYIQTGVELYFNKCRYYPGSAQPQQECGPPVRIFSADPRTNWRAFEDALKISGLSINAVPNDPFASTVFVKSYRYSTPVDNNYSYVLRAELEDVNNAALQNDIDGSDYFGLDCSDTPVPYYCIGI